MSNESTMESQRLRINMCAYDHKILDDSLVKIIETARRTGATVMGPVLLPVRIKKYTVNRSVHTDKKSREQFEMRVYKRLVDIMDASSKTAEELGKLELSAGVDVVIKMF